MGLGRVLRREHPELRCVRLDLDGRAASMVQAQQLCRELLSSVVRADGEDQVAWRGDIRHIARLQRMAAGSQASKGLPLRLAITTRGSLDNLTWQPAPRRTPGPGEVELRVHATGLNFRDLLNALGLYPGNLETVGDECAGEVVAVGEGVTQFAVGEAVVGLAPGCFGQYVIANADALVHKPASLTAVEAATIPVAFMTAHYCLHTIAQIQPGDRILIHAAAGGVGMAAVQIAQAAGAEVYCTASPAKWPALAALGVTHLYNSRTLAFGEEILADTNGQGVDIVLNSLTGEGFIAQSMAILAPHGCFVEISKRDVWSSDQAAQSRADVAYFLVDFAEAAARQPGLTQRMLREVMNEMGTGKLKPLPAQVFPSGAAVEAFRTMQQARHVGKVVITQPPAAEGRIRPDATYLITGGLGGLGLQVARWLVEQGARHLLLLGRRPPTPDANAQLTSLRAQGTEVTVVQADVSDRTQVAQALAAIPTAYPLRGVIHAAGVLADGAVLQQS